MKKYYGKTFSGLIFLRYLLFEAILQSDCSITGY